MKKAVRAAQQEYINTKAVIDVLREEKSDLEREYIKNHSISNVDGSIPESIFCIDDELVFEKVSEDFYKTDDAISIERAYNQAIDHLKITEDKLIKYGLAISPAGIRTTLENGVKGNYTIRQKLVSLVLKLDVSTIAKI